MVLIKYMTKLCCPITGGCNTVILVLSFNIHVQADQTPLLKDPDFQHMVRPYFNQYSYHV
jgi:hypothetical protein